MSLYYLVKAGKVVCQQVSCPPVSCINPSFIDGECCPVCLSKLELLAATVWDSVHRSNPYGVWVCVFVFYTDKGDGWSPWSEWTHCSVTCGRGGQQRGRSCNGIMPACTGPSLQTRSCMMTKCDRKGRSAHLIPHLSWPHFIFLWSIECSQSQGNKWIVLKEQTYGEWDFRHCHNWKHVVFECCKCAHSLEP